MVDKISFRGIQNVGGRVVTEYGKDTIVNYRMVAELTDECGKDLTEWKPILKRFPSPGNDNFIRIERSIITPSSSANSSIIEPAELPFFRFNGKKLLTTKENIPIFSKISQFLNLIPDRVQIAKLLEENTPFDLKDEYKKSQKLKDNFAPQKLTEKEIDSMHSNLKIENTAKHLRNTLDLEMQEFFDIEQKNDYC